MLKKQSLIIFLLLISTLVSADIYQCKAADGKTSYQSTPCATEESSTTVSKSERVEQQNTDLPEITSNFNASHFIGTWCFYKQEGLGETVNESVTIKLNKDKTYSWYDSGIYNEYNLTWEQEGTWRVEEGDNLYMTEVGSHHILKIKKNLIVLERVSKMYLKKGYC